MFLPEDPTAAATGTTTTPILNSMDSLQLVSNQRRKMAASVNPRSLIRGVNIGGWLLLERFITPYMFTVTNCHLQGNFCWYPGQYSAPPVSSRQHKYCDMYQCQLVLDEATQHFPTNEYDLTAMFSNKAIAREYLSYHWENFVTKEDVIKLSEVGVTHVRVPMPHWIMGDLHDNEPFVDGQWLYFVRFVGWCREYEIEVWPEISTAPGMHWGLDKLYGHSSDTTRCEPWDKSPEDVSRSLKVVQDIANAILEDDLQDVVTGIGILSEPLTECDPTVVRDFYNEAQKAIQNTLGEDTAIHIGDMFNASSWNDGWWTNEATFSNTMLDSHYFQVFDPNYRKLSPKEHVALVCNEYTKDLESCCYEDAPKNLVPSKGISRIVGEWSAAFDTEPIFKVEEMFDKLLLKWKNSGDLNVEFPIRTLSSEHKDFLRHFVLAQMVAYESGSSNGLSRGWFFWTLKMESNIFAEWDFLRGLTEGWIPTLPGPTESSETVYGTCETILASTKDVEGIVYPFPSQAVGEEVEAEKEKYGQSETEMGDEREVDDEVVEDEKQQGQGKSSSASTLNADPKLVNKDTARTGIRSWFPMFCMAFFVWAIWKVFFKGGNYVGNRHQYTSLDGPTQLTV